jgi:hypothetical protein
VAPVKDAEEPGPLPGRRYRTGMHLGRTVYLMTGPEPSKQDELIGVMDTPELGEMVVAALNRYHAEDAG